TILDDLAHTNLGQFLRHGLVIEQSLLQSGLVLKQVAAVIAAKKISIPYEEARDLALRARKFMQERGRAPDITSADAWEKRMA
ncbi:hypothetical protein ACC677_37830, partial [Rhizobium ruizarguesonis]